MMGGMVSRFMPSAPRYIMRAMVPEAVRGRRKVGSVATKSVNQAVPPVVIDSTGAFVIPRRPKNMLVMKRPFTQSGRRFLIGCNWCLF